MRNHAEFCVYDNFFTAAECNRLVRWALRDGFREPEDITGYRSPGYPMPELRERVADAFGLYPDPNTWLDDPEEMHNNGNGVVYFGLSEGPKAEVCGVHWDEPVERYTMLVYLVDGPADAGTGWYRHKPTGLVRAPISADARRLKTTVESLREQVYRDSQKPGQWDVLATAGLVKGRAVLYPSDILHRACQHFGDRPENGRLYYTLRFYKED